MYNCFDQSVNESSIKKRLSMHHIQQEVAKSDEHYLLEEVEYGHINIRVCADNLSFVSALKEVTGLELPTQPLQSEKNDEFVLYWISPDEFLLLVAVNTEYEIEKQLREKAEGHYSIINVSSAQTLLTLSGDRAESILKKSVPYDIHPSNLPIGKVVTTVFAKTQVLLSRTSSAPEFNIIVRRSFSDYVWQWIVDAGGRE